MRTDKAKLLRIEGLSAYLRTWSTASFIPISAKRFCPKSSALLSSIVTASEDLYLSGKAAFCLATYWLTHSRCKPEYALRYFK